MLPPPSVIASRDARRLALVLSEVGGHGAPVGGGWMACDVQGSWATYAAGLGIDGPVPDSELDRLVTWYRDQGRQPAVQITPYQHPSLFPALAARGFGPHEVETALARMARPAEPLVSGLDFEPVDPADAASVAAFVDAQMRGFYAPDPPPPGIIPITSRVARAPRCRLWVVRMRGEIVASGGIEVFENSAVLIAGAVLPHARRQGVQSAFIEFRVRQAAMMGIEYCLVGSLAGGPTERNALRAGFSPVYNPVDLRAPVRSAP